MGKEKRISKLKKITKKVEEELRKERPSKRALKNAFLRLYDFATKDHLTGVFNRASLDETLSREMARAIRHGLPLCAIMIDIDNFKDYNDKYGHLQGDAALKTVTALIQKYTRPEDFVARYGGEEFTVVLADTNLEQASKTAKRLRKAVEKAVIKAVSKEIEPDYKKVTISLGVAQMPKNGDAQMMMDLADKALYEAKRKGKNIVCIFSKGEFA